jgi:general stress protein 26
MQKAGMAKDKDPRKHLLELLQDFDTAMLVTRSPGGRLHARPMDIAEITETGELWFCSGLDSGKISEIAGEPEVAVAIQGKTKYLSLSGRARVSTDPQHIARLWKEDWKVWFPDGPSDPNLCLVGIDPSEGEWWDNSGTRGLKFAFEAVKAYVKGEPMPDVTDENARVRL